MSDQCPETYGQGDSRWNNLVGNQCCRDETRLSDDSLHRLMRLLRFAASGFFGVSRRLGSHYSIIWTDGGPQKSEIERYLQRAPRTEFPRWVSPLIVRKRRFDRWLVVTEYHRLSRAERQLIDTTSNQGQESHQYNVPGLNLLVKRVLVGHTEVFVSKAPSTITTGARLIIYLGSLVDLPPLIRVLNIPEVRQRVRQLAELVFQKQVSNNQRS